MCCLPFLSSYSSFALSALVFETWMFYISTKMNEITGHLMGVESTSLCCTTVVQAQLRGWMDAWMDTWMGGWIDGCMNWHMDAWMMDVWMDRVMDDGLAFAMFFSCESRETNWRLLPYLQVMVVVPDCLFYLTLPTFTCDHTHTPHADLHIIPLFADWVEMKPQDMSVMFQVLNSADVLDAWDGDWSCIANESGGSWQCSKLLQDWLKVFRVGGAACGCSVGTGNPWQTLPLLLSALMESEESLEVASVSSTPPQKQTLSFSTSMPRLLTLHPPGATPILSWSLFISSVSGLRVLPLVNRLCLECNEQWWNVLFLYIHILVLFWLNHLYSNAIFISLLL